MEKLVDELFLSLRALALLFGRAERTIQNWIAASEARRQGSNGSMRYYLPDILNYYLARIYEPPVSENLEKVKLEQEKLKVEKMRLELEEKKGRLIDRDEVVLEWSQRVSALRSGLVGLEFKLASKLAGKSWSRAELRKILREEIHDLLKLYAQEGKFTPNVFDMPFEKFEHAYWQLLDRLPKADCDKPKVKVECPKRRRKK